MDYSTVSKGANLIKCVECQTISNPDAVKIELSTFETKQYAGSHQTKHTTHVDEYPEPVTRSFLQAKILTEKFIKNKKPRILDIGCFDGCLLVELNNNLNNADLWGFDINPHLKEFFPQKDNFHFISTGLENLEDSFDMITLSVCIYYIPDLRDLMVSISRLLKNNGILFIQIPDIRSNPYNLLMGDQSFIFTEKSLKNVCTKFGYRTNVISNDYFPRELLIVAQKDKNSGDNYVEDYLFEKNIMKLDHFKEKLEKITHDNITVLGTTMGAAFVDEIIGERIQFFVDENLSNFGETFRGKKIVHPENLNDTNHTILPFGKTGLMIQERFEKLYSGIFTVV
jgi:SAM-dependent methyltransferase